MDSDLRARLNGQIKHELDSAYIYLAMSAELQAQDYDGFAHWMRLQSQEELVHAMRLYDHVLSRGERVTLLSVLSMSLCVSG